jgi:2-hydroxy-6-oxonona-2,4-dienedioate hydrolase
MRKHRFSVFLRFVFCFLGFTGFSGPCVFSQDTSKPFDNSSFLTVDSVRFHFRVWNGHSAKPAGKVFMVHGFCGSTFAWRKNCDTLAALNYKVVAVDLPGFGYSERNVKINQSQSNRARLLWDLLKQIDQDDTAGWNIVGHSMGGGTVEAMALMQPGRTRSLTIIDGMVFIRNRDLKGAFITASRWGKANKIFVSYARNNIINDRSLTRLLKKAYGYVPDSSLIEAYLKPLRIEGSAESIISVFSNADEICKLDASGLAKLPVMLVWGKKDRILSLQQGKKLQKAVPGIDLKVIPTAHHMAMETHPGSFNRYLVDFLKMNNPHGSLIND